MIVVSVVVSIAGVFIGIAGAKFGTFGTICTLSIGGIWASKSYTITTEKDVIDKSVGGVLYNLNNSTESEKQQLKQSIEKVCPSCSALENLGMPTLSQQSVSELQNMQTGLAGLTFSNIKI